MSLIPLIRKLLTEVFSTLVYFGAEENLSSVTAFQPTVLAGIGYITIQAQLMTIPVYATAFVLTLVCAWMSERLRQRFCFVIVGSIVITIGLALQLGTSLSGVRYLGMFFILSGSYIVMPVTVVWLAINMGKGYKRTAALGLMIPVGNAGAILSANVFLT